MTEPHSGGWLSKFCCCEGAVTERRYKSGGSIAMEIPPPPPTMQIFENISSTEGEIEAVEKLSSVGKKIKLFTSEKNKKDMYGERGAMSERYQLLCFFLLKNCWSDVYW